MGAEHPQFSTRVLEPQSTPESAPLGENRRFKIFHLSAELLKLTSGNENVFHWPKMHSNVQISMFNFKEYGGSSSLSHFG